MLTPSVKKFGSGWMAVRRNERDRIVWECQHEHRNRDASTAVSGMSALDCARGVTAESLPAVIRMREAAVALLKGAA